MSTLQICYLVIGICVVIFIITLIKKTVDFTVFFVLIVAVAVCGVIIYNVTKSKKYSGSFEDKFGEYQQIFNSACAGPSTMDTDAARGKVLALQLNEDGTIKQVDAYVMHGFISKERTPAMPEEVETLVFRMSGKTDQQIGNYTGGEKCFMAYEDFYAVDLSRNACVAARLEGKPEDCLPVTSSDNNYASPSASVIRAFLGDS